MSSYSQSSKIYSYGASAPRPLYWPFLLEIPIQCAYPFVERYVQRCSVRTVLSVLWRQAMASQVGHPFILIPVQQAFQVMGIDVMDLHKMDGGK